jgi:amidase
LTIATASAAVAALAAGDVGSEELLDSQLDRVARWNDELNLLVALDVDRARAEARAADQARRRGESLGPLHGLPITIKDSFETEGIVTTSGAPELAGHVPARDADSVHALKTAGAIVFGKTNLPLYAGDFQSYNDVYGLSRNPWDPSRTVGGSSGGAAAAVACGMTLLELGSDIGGSIRVPAHYNGVFGHKSTYGVIGQRGHIPGPPGTMADADLAVNGPLGRSAADLALAMRVLAPQLAQTPVDPRRLRVAVVDSHPSALTSAACRGAVRRVADALADAGATVTELAVPGVSLDEQYLLYLRLLSAALAGGYPASARTAAVEQLADPALDAITRARLEGLVLTHLDWQRLDEQRWKLIDAYERLFDTIDVVVAPIAPTPAFPHNIDLPFSRRILDVDGEQMPYPEHVAWAGFATLPYLPATAVPAGVHDGLPVGVQVVGRRFADHATIAVAGLVERELGGFTPPPLT